ncbi:MAG: hypothetical protein ACT6Q5_13380 [Sphingopyxis solisilvae]|uniref:hypothetical protein n=1 Tax=Sphingopyxis solisilvae TaxID=1886788 RepID=UPI0040365EF5
MKPFWKSKTIWAAVGVFLMSIAPELGIGENDVADGAGAIGQIVTGGLALVAIWGRLKAKDRIG